METSLSRRWRRRSRRRRRTGPVLLLLLPREENVNSDASAARAVFHFAAYWFWFCVARLYCICSSTRIHIHIWIKVARVVWQTSRNSERRREFSISSQHSLSVSWQIKRENGFAIASIDSAASTARSDDFLRLRHDRKSRWCVMQLLFKMPPLLWSPLHARVVVRYWFADNNPSSPSPPQQHIKMCYGLFFAPINTLSEDWWYIRFCWKQLMDPDCIGLNGFLWEHLNSC